MRKNSRDSLNKFRLAPINTGLSIDGDLNLRIISFHEKRSGHGIKYSMLGNVAIDDRGKTNDGTVVFEKITARKLSDFVSAVERNGSSAGIQLSESYYSSHSTRSWKPVDQAYVFAASYRLSSMDACDLDSILEKFVTAAKKSLDHGIELVQFHAAHGYFLSTLLDPRINRRSDRLGDRRIVLEKMLAPFFNRTDGALEWRLSITTNVGEMDEDVELCADTIALLTEFGINKISISDGHYDLSRSRIYPFKGGPEIPQLKNIKFLRDLFPNITMDICGNINNLDFCLELGERYEFSLGRNLIANPEYIIDFFSGEISRKCMNRNRCHFYTRGAPHLECGENDNLFDD